MATITFKTKVKRAISAEDVHLYDYLQVPQLTRAHCDMSAFRFHPKFGGIANSDLFLNALKRIRRDVLQSDYSDTLRLDRLPANMTVDASGFLAIVTIEV